GQAQLGVCLQDVKRTAGREVWGLFFSADSFLFCHSNRLRGLCSLRINLGGVGAPMTRVFVHSGIPDTAALRQAVSAVPEKEQAAAFQGNFRRTTQEMVADAQGE